MNSNRSSLGAWAAVVVGVGYLVATVAFLLLPEAQRPGADFDQQMVSLAEDRTAFLILNWAVVVVAVAGLAAVPAVSSLVRGAAPEWVRWGSALAYLGGGCGRPP